MAGEKILVVEDDGIIAYQLQHMLTNMEYNVLATVATGEDAIGNVEKILPDLILMDISLAGKLNGIETAAQIRSQYDIPVLYLTAYSEDLFLQQAKSTEPYAYLIKPIQYNELRANIEMALYRHKLETRLKENERWLDTTLRSIGDAVITTDINGCIIFMNPVAEHLTGWKQEECFGRDLSEIFHIINEHTRNPVPSPVEKIFQEGIVVGLANHTLLVRKDGTEIPIDDSGSPIQDDKGNITGAVLVFRDVSHRKELEAQLLQAQKMQAMGTLAGGIAHDFNNILYPIVGYAELAIEDLEAALSCFQFLFRSQAGGFGMSTQSDAREQEKNLQKLNDIREYLREILKAADRAKDLVQEILIFSRKGKHKTKILYIQHIIKDTLKFIEKTLPSTIKLRSRINPLCRPISADPSRINQIIMNLCTNAYHAIKEKGGLLEVSLDEIVSSPEDMIGKAERYLKLTVSDTGIGMNDTVKARIFEPYFTTKNTGEGIGLGLSIVHGIVSEYNGIIRVQSEPGKGTCFEIFLPCAEGVENITSEPLYAPLDSRCRGHVLLVDDEKENVKMIRQLLERIGCTVTSCYNGLNAYEAFCAASESFDLIITDMTMPKMTGDKLAEAVLKIRSDIPIILCTGYHEGVTEEKAAAIGIQKMLAKPVSIKKLSEIISKILC